MTIDVSKLSPAFKQAAYEWTQIKTASMRLQKTLADPRTSLHRREKIILQRLKMMRRASLAARAICADMKSRKQWDATFPAHQIQIALVVEATARDFTPQPIPYSEASNYDTGLYWVRQAKASLNTITELCREICVDPVLGHLIEQAHQSPEGPR